MSPTKRRTQLWLVFGGLLIAVLMAGVVTVGSYELPFQSGKWSDVFLLFAVSTFIVAALLIFGLVMSRSLVRLWAERRADRLGTRFKTKMVGAAMGISLLPVVTLFFISYGLLNHTLARWFPRPLEIAVDESQKLLADFGRTQLERMNQLAAQARIGLPGDKPAELIHAALLYGADAAWILDSRGIPSETQISIRSADRKPEEFQLVEHPAPPRYVQVMPSGAELWQSGDMSFVAGRAPLGERSLVVARRVPEDMLDRFRTVETQMRDYDQQKQQYRAYKTSILLVLSLFTLLLLFTSTWFALFLSKQVTVPIQALAEATLEVTAGHFDHRVDVQAQDELGLLVRSFNLMTAQLGESHRQIAEFTRSLQQAVQEMERRRKLMEAILENIPTAVISLDDAGNILRTNRAVLAIFGEASRSARTLQGLVGEEAARGFEHLMRRSMRMGTASRELELGVGGRLVHAAVTVSSLGPRRSNPGFVIVVDDLTDLLRAQKAAAWQEVAQRIAHEIKNPLTPIQLSAQRLSRFLERRPDTARAENSELVRLVGECSSMIEREVAALKSLVDEFSQFARFPSARFQTTDANAVVSSALDIFHGRLEGVHVRTRLTTGLPAVKADPELLRRVIVNLIDNAAEAMENGTLRELEISTRTHPDSDMLEIVVADSGHGISPEDKDKLFLPHFSTKDRGTGLGLAIASRIIAEHNGMLRVEDNSPVGARFVISLPVAEVSAAPPVPAES